MYNGIYFFREPAQVKREGGYIALVSVVIMAAVLSMLMVSQGLVVWNSGQSSLRTWAKEQSRLLSDSCVRLAVLQLKAAIQPSAQPIVLESNTCVILSAQSIGSAWEVRTRAVVLGAETNLVATIDGASFAVTMESEPP